MPSRWSAATVRDGGLAMLRSEAANGTLAAASSPCRESACQPAAPWKCGLPPPQPATSPRSPSSQALRLMPPLRRRRLLASHERHGCLLPPFPPPPVELAAEDHHIRHHVEPEEEDRRATERPQRHVDVGEAHEDRQRLEGRLHHDGAEDGPGQRLFER